ncbi:MAG TPA: hypothetical protein VG758_16720 [Hyphomicrobiaceae bacterium]|jgi:hypothetical protein|nr:hypothetical protein [Hyphomicrobiaceae bacterium]
MRLGASRRRAIGAALGATTLWLAGCSGAEIDDSRAGLSCIDDTPRCIERRQVALKVLLADKDHKWVREPATPHAHATGVRLFAFRSQKGELSCEELLYGHREATAAPKALKGHQGFSPAQVSRASLFAAEVQRELAAEMRKRRCRA